MAVHYAVLRNLCLVDLVIHLSRCDFLKADEAHEILPQTAEFVWIFLQICSVDKERMDNDFKPTSMIANLRYSSQKLLKKLLKNVWLFLAQNLSCGNSCHSEH